MGHERERAVKTFPGTPFGFAVMSRAEMARFTHDAPYVVISISTPGFAGSVRFAECAMRRDVLSLEFGDYDHEALVLGRDHEIWDGSRPVFFDHSLGQRVKSFVEGQRDAVRFIVCHCHAGLSRSPAMAAALSVWLNGNDVVAEAIRTWISVDRMDLDPELTVWNRLVHETLAEVLGVSPVGGAPSDPPSSGTADS